MTQTLVPSISEQLAALATAPTLPNYSDDQAQEVALRVADTVGVALAGREESIAATIAGTVGALAGTGDDGGATLWVDGGMSRADLAAMANGTLAHAIDFDDTHAGSVTHVSSVIVPTGLALGEELQATGAEVLAAMTVGYETMIRVGLASVGGYQVGGFHTTGVCGPFGAAACAGRLLGLTQRQLVNAFGVAASQASGVQEFLSDGSWSKRFHPGWAAHAGIIAARLAANGFEGPLTAFEGRFGLFNTHIRSQKWDARAVVEGLGTEWHMRTIAYKRYPVCHVAHPFIEAALELRRQVRPEEIKEVVLRVSKEGVPIVCEPWSRKLQPEDCYDARFSLPVCVAAAILDGEDVSYTDPTKLLRPEVLELARRCRYEVDPSSRYPGVFDGVVELVTRTGERMERHEELPSGLADPRVAEGMRRKFRENTIELLGEAGTDDLWTALVGMGSVRDVSKLLAPLRHS